MIFKTAKAPQPEPKCPQATLQDSQRCPKGAPRTPMAPPRTTRGSLQGYPRTPRTPQGTPKRPKDDLGELWQVLRIIEKTNSFSCISSYRGTAG